MFSAISRWNNGAVNVNKDQSENEGYGITNLVEEALEKKKIEKINEQKGLKRQQSMFNSSFRASGNGSGDDDAEDEDEENGEGGTTGAEGVDGEGGDGYGGAGAYVTTYP